MKHKLLLTVDCSAKSCQAGKAKCAYAKGTCALFEKVIPWNSKGKLLRVGECVEAEKAFKALAPHFDCVSLEDLGHTTFVLKKAIQVVVVCFNENEYLASWPFPDLHVCAMGISEEDAINAFRDILVSLALHYFAIAPAQLKTEPRARQWQQALKSIIHKKKMI